MRYSDNKTYIIYAHISPSGKVYIGQTGLKPKKRWGKDGSQYLKKKKDGSYINPVLANAILKYGWNNLEHKILFTGLSKLDADLIEQDLIYYYKSKGMSYNIADGGAGCPRKRFTAEELKEHRRQYEKKYYEENKEVTLQKGRDRYKANKDTVTARQKKYYEEHKEEKKAYRLEYNMQHKEEKRAYSKSWYANLTPEQKKARIERTNESRRKRKLLSKQNDI